MKILMKILSEEEIEEIRNPSKEVLALEEENRRMNPVGYIGTKLQELRRNQKRLLATLDAEREKVRELELTLSDWKWLADKEFQLTDELKTNLTALLEAADVVIMVIQKNLAYANYKDEPALLNAFKHLTTTAAWIRKEIGE